MNIVSMTVNGMRYEGWENIAISHGVDQLAGSFSLSISDKWEGQSEGWAIQAGDACVIKIGNDVVITGYVDVNDPYMTKTSHSINIQGRDKTGDLVDCSAEVKEYQGQNFEFIAADVCKPYGIYVNTQLASDENGYTAKANIKPANVGGSKIPRQSAETGDTCHAFLDKIAKVQAVLLISDRKGGLLITRAGLSGRANDSLIEDQNIKEIGYQTDFSSVFSKVTVKGQAHAAKTDTGQTLTAKESALAKGSITRQTSSGAVGRHRPLVLEASEQADAARCQRQSEWEASTREAKARKITVIVQGWRQTNGALWEINTLTTVSSQSMRLNEDLLISNVTFTIDMDGGSITVLTLYPPNAFDLLPELPKNEEAKTSDRGKGKKGKSSKKTAKSKFYDFTSEDDE